MKIISLLTDFTNRDGYVGIMKGVILGITDDVHIIDVSHSIPPQNVRLAAYILGRNAPYFPPGSLHLAVVDPGVGTARRGLIARLGAQLFVGPDNGLLTLLYQHARKGDEPIHMHALENEAYMLKPVSQSFHGRDVFAPAAAYYFQNVPLEAFGPEVPAPVLLDLPEPRRTRTGWTGEIIHVDAFGNLAANIDQNHLENSANIRIIIKNHVIAGLKSTFGAGNPGDLVAIIDSFGYLSVCVVNGSAADLLKVGVGETIQVDMLSS